ncbi:MAG: S46 family peptidase [Verrucomicrobia bacterium]|nr:S46 family peptidase [Verrucomicrobiota bacterium]
MKPFIRAFVPVCVPVVMFVTSRPVTADEGMWMPQQIPALASKLEALGFTGDASAFADLTGYPMGAIVSLGGCSASFVSPDGLIATNHHCVQRSLQYNSTPERNLMEQGFLAKTRSDELWNGPGSRVFVTVSVRDVTDDIVGKLDPMLADRMRFEAVEKRVKQQTAAGEQGGLRCTIASFFEGKKWFEISQMEIEDVRLVYAPAAGIGNFGGEVDNWQWPRHTGDFSFYRAYVSPAGKAVAYAKENVPYRPKHWLRVSPRGANPGDLIFVAGYPGRTSRLTPYAEVQQTVEWSMPRTVKRNTDQIALLEKLSMEDQETAIRVAPRLRGLHNSLTKTQGVIKGMHQGGLLAEREAHEKSLLAWIDADPKRKADSGDVLPALNALVADRARTRERDALLAEVAGGTGSVMGAAQTIYRLSIEKPKSDMNRDPEYQERNWSRLREAQDRLQRSLDVKADRVLMTYSLAEVAKLPASQRIDVLDHEIGLAAGMGEAEAGKAIDAFLGKLLAGTRLYQKDVRLACHDMSTADLLAMNDTAIMLTAALYPLTEANREKAKERSGATYRLGPRYAEVLLARHGGAVAPDANGTLRVAYGQVMGVPARDGLRYLPQTTLQGIVEKATGASPFNAPAAELAAIQALRAGKMTPYLDPQLNDVPVDFLSTVDTTGGNSGSATLNSKGELVGLLFDGTYDTVASDYRFDPVRTRSIHVDTRYMLWTMAEVDGATNLLDEINGLPRSVDAPQPTH